MSPREVIAADTEPSAAERPAEPRAPAIAFITTEHFTLQGARAATIAESTGRATMFFAAVSGGLVALGLVATASHLDTAFFAFSLVLLPALAFVGLVTFERALQSGIEDLGYARRIARLRAYYFDYAPELTAYLLSVPPEERLQVQGLTGGFLQAFRTIAGMIAVITSVLSGAALGLGVAAAVDSLLASFVCGGAFGLVVLILMVRYERRTWERAYQQMIDTDASSI